MTLDQSSNLNRDTSVKFTSDDKVSVNQDLFYSLLAGTKPGYYLNEGNNSTYNDYTSPCTEINFDTSSLEYAWVNTWVVRPGNFMRPLCTGEDGIVVRSAPFPPDHKGTATFRYSTGNTTLVPNPLFPDNSKVQHSDCNTNISPQIQSMIKKAFEDISHRFNVEFIQQPDVPDTKGSIVFANCPVPPGERWAGAAIGSSNGAGFIHFGRNTTVVEEERLQNLVNHEILHAIGIRGHAPNGFPRCLTTMNPSLFTVDEINKHNISTIGPLDEAALDIMYGPAHNFNITAVKYTREGENFLFKNTCLDETKKSNSHSTILGTPLVPLHIQAFIGIASAILELSAVLLAEQRNPQLLSYLSPDIATTEGELNCKQKSAGLIKDTSGFVLYATLPFAAAVHNVIVTSGHAADAQYRRDNNVADPTTMSKMCAKALGAAVCAGAAEAGVRYLGDKYPVMGYALCAYAAMDVVSSAYKCAEGGQGFVSSLAQEASKRVRVLRYALPLVGSLLRGNRAVQRDETAAHVAANVAGDAAASVTGDIVFSDGSSGSVVQNAVDHMRNNGTDNRQSALQIV